MTYYTKTFKALTTVSAIAMLAISGISFAQTPTAFSWGHGGQTAETDKALSDAQIQIKYDGINVIPQLNVSANTGDVVVSRQESVSFQTYWNYGAFINRAEVRIFPADQSVRGKQLLILPVHDGVATMPANSGLPEDLIYVLRVYDSEGRFDETEAKLLSLTNGSFKSVEALPGEKLSGYGIDRTAIRNLRVKGGSVTVYGTNVQDNALVSVLGQSVPVDSHGQFAVQHILPYGEHSVDVSVSENGQRTIFDRDIRLDGTDFFYVAIGDLTLGNQNSDGPADFLASSDEDFDDVYLNGRGALYAKGRVKGDYLVTAAIDTGEDRLSDIFRNLDDKDPRQLLRRLDADRFYPVYGDDSTLVEDAPTQGRFYLRIEKDDSHILWGNFATQITGTEFAHLDRGLYGAIADYNSQNTTSFGERATQITAFAADPGTIPAREEYRGTGGSVYFLERQDLSIGSERVRVEVRDKVSGLVLETRNLRPQEDYDVDYIQGRILLSDPLQSTARDNQVVRDGALSGNDVFLVVRYEYTPTLSDVGGYTVGGRATQWLGDTLRLGATAQNETTGSADQNLIGVDALLRRSAGTYLKAEIAQTEGPGFAQSNSTDGGFTFDNQAAQGATNVKAKAYRAEAALDLADISNVVGQLRGYYDHQDDGFSGTNRLAIGEVDRWGASASIEASKFTRINAQFDELSSVLRGNTRAAYADISHDFSDKATVSAGVRHDDREIIATGFNPAIDGSRTDLSGQFDYKANERASVYAFGQATVDRDQSRSRNNRFGIGGQVAINDRLSLNGEISEGDGGLGANAQATFKRSDNSEYYLGYALSADRTDTGFATQTQSLANQGVLTFGAKTRFNDSLSVYGEERFGYGQNQTSLTHVYGLTFNPSEVWSFGANVENGQIDDDVNGTFDRTAVSFSVGRATEAMRLASNLEARFEDGVQAGTSRDRTTWLMRNTASFDAGENWEMLGRFNFALSESDQSGFLDADFIEGVVGAAYRPVNNDRFNGLLKYTYFEDLSPAQQISSGGQQALARQKSQIFSVDGIYDLTEKLSVGAKYGFRSGEVALSRTSDDFVTSDAHIGIVRLDYHVVKKWDLLLEGRMLSSSLADDERFGALAGVYRHVGDNAKFGVGYSFSKFSDDLRDFSADSDGFFINLVGKF